ncbi:unnamed protein product, partial [Timema podura]|nr:unnamed protein product [Timema podura]
MPETCTAHSYLNDCLKLPTGTVEDKATKFLNKLVADTNYDLLVEAVRNGDITTLKKMFQDNLDVSVLMFEVASRENPDVLDALLQPEQDNLDSTRILKAVKYNRVNSMRSLLGAGVEPSTTEEFGHTIIQYAIIHNTLESLLKALIVSPNDNNNIPSFKIPDETTSLYSQDGYETDSGEIYSGSKLKDNLKKYIMQTNKEGRNAFHTAALMGDLNSLKLLYLYASEEHVDAIGADFSRITYWMVGLSGGWYAGLYMAMVEVVSLDAWMASFNEVVTASPKDIRTCSSGVVARIGLPMLPSKFHAFGITIGPGIWTFVTRSRVVEGLRAPEVVIWTLTDVGKARCSIISRNLGCILDLFSCRTCDGDVDLDVMDHSGQTPLSMAIRAGYYKCVKLLIKNGSDLSMRFKSGVSAIQLLLKECPKGYEIMDK